MLGDNSEVPGELLTIGGALLDMACAEAARLGCPVSIHVEKNNPAQRLYRRKGFVPAGENGPSWLMIRAPGPGERRPATISPVAPRPVAAPPAGAMSPSAATVRPCCRCRTRLTAAWWPTPRPPKWN